MSGAWPSNSTKKSGWHWDKVNNRLDFGFNGIRSGSIGSNGVITYVVGTALYADNTVFALGTDSDIALVERASVLNANTALAGVIVGTPVTPAVAANSFILGNITADGDIMLVTQTGGNSHAAMWVDASAALTVLYAGAGVEQLRLVAAGANVADGARLYVGVAAVPGSTAASNWIGLEDSTTDPAGTLTNSLAMYTPDGGDSLDFLHADGTTDSLGT